MDDRIIVRCILEDGKKELFSLVVKSYRGKVFSCAYGITQNTELAKEVAQQTFIRAFTHLSSWNGKELGAWLTAIAAHEALNLLEKEKRKINVSEMTVSTEGYSAERERLLSALEQAIEELPEQDRQIIRLHYFDNMRTEDIAELMRLSHANVLVKLHRIRERLKKRLQNEE
jgi:RNA polymerase sigma-70 factor (ECF subfamily)